MHHKAVLIAVLAAIFTLGLFAHGHRSSEPVNPNRLLPILPPHPVVAPGTVRF